MKRTSLSIFLSLFFVVTTSLKAEVIDFEHLLDSRFSSEEIWQDLSQAMTNSRNSRLWPTASQVSGDGLVDRGIIEVTYSMGLFSPTYSYILDVNYEKKSFSYTAFGAEHPFIGGATISILPGKGDFPARLHWKGSYDTAGAGFFARRAFLNFERRFFQELKRGLLETP